MTEFIDVDGRSIATERRAGRTPGLFWLSGYRSDMTGSKAMAVDAFGAGHGLAVTRFDYSGHGASPGDVNNGLISQWLEETEAVFATTAGPQVVIGSSMGGWLALLLARALRQRRDDRLKGLVLIAPATDMTDLILSQMTKKQRKALDKDGFVEERTPYAAMPYRITRALIEDGERHRLFGRVIETGCPVTILQGALDRDVPKEHTLKLIQHLITDPVTLTLVPDGEHRLSRPDDLALLEKAIERTIAD